MRSPRQLISFGVGVLFVWGNAAPGLSQSTPAPSPMLNPTKQEQPHSSTDDADRKNPLALEQDSENRTLSAPEAPTQPKTDLSPQATQRQTERTPLPRDTSVRRTSAPLTAPAPTKTSQTTLPKTAPLPPQNGSPPPASGDRQLGSPSETSLQPIICPASVSDLVPAPADSSPIGRPKEGRAPEYLNPDPNPLSFPTKPEEVKLRGLQPISLNQALELAKRNNRSLQVARQQLDRSYAVLREARAELYPTLSTQASLNHSRSASGEISDRLQSQNPFSLLNQQDRDTANTAFSSNINLSYDLFTFGGRSARIRAARQQVRSDELQVEITEAQTYLDTATDYYDLQEADEAARINLSAVRNAEASLRDTEALERAGLGTQFDVLRAQVQLANAQQDFVNACAQRQVRRRELAQRLSLAPMMNIVAGDPVQAAGQWPLSLEESIVLAFKNRAELEQQLAQRDLAYYQRISALSAIRPTVSLSAQYELLDVFDDTVGIADGYSFAATVRWTFFDGGAAQARARQQEINQEIAETRFADNREQVRLQVETAYATLRSSFENIRTAEIALAQARQSLRLARLRFQAGVGTQTEVINSENDLTRAEGNRINAILGYNRALASLQRSVTNLPIATGDTLPSIPSRP